VGNLVGKVSDEGAEGVMRQGPHSLRRHVGSGLEPTSGTHIRQPGVRGRVAENVAARPAFHGGPGCCNTVYASTLDSVPDRRP
jgi:hypothetical protein